MFSNIGRLVNRSTSRHPYLLGRATGTGLATSSFSLPDQKIALHVGNTEKRSYGNSTAKRQPQHQLNINHALKKADEGQYFHDLIKGPVSTLQGIGPKHLAQLETLGFKTVEQLAEYKFFHLSRCLMTLAKTEEPGQRSDASVMNINKGLDKDYENMSLQEIVDLPVYALQGISESKGELWASLGVKTMSDLAEFKYCKWAEALVVAAKFEEK
jgi:hypothetical protein